MVSYEIENTRVYMAQKNRLDLRLSHSKEKSGKGRPVTVQQKTGKAIMLSPFQIKNFLI